MTITSSIMKTAKTILILCAAAVCFASCKEEVDMTLRQNTLFENAEIQQIEASDAWEVTVVADTASTFVEVAYSAYLQDHVEVKMEGRKLEIGFAGTVYPEINSVYRATVHLGTLERVEANAGAVVKFQGDFTGPQLGVSLSEASVCNGLSWRGTKAEIKLEGASKLSGFQFVGDSCKADLEGASQLNGAMQASGRIEIDLKDASRLVNKGGATGEADIALQAASLLNLSLTQVERMHVALSGGSEATVHVVSLLEGSLTDGATLYYQGAPQIDVDCSDDSRIVPL